MRILSLVGKPAHAGLVAIALTASAVALASGGEHGEAAAGHAHGPGADVIFQAVNFALFVGLLAFVLRKKVAAFFAGREVSFKQLLVKAESAKTEAEAKRREIQQRLAKLESSSAESLEKAKAEAELLKARMAAEAEELRRGLREDAERSVRIELEKAMAELRADMIAQATSLAKSTLTEKIQETDQKRLQTEFVEKIQVVQP